MPYVEYVLTLTKAFYHTIEQYVHRRGENFSFDILFMKGVVKMAACFPSKLTSFVDTFYSTGTL